ncbi:putative holin [Mycobacterium sp. ITM-2016-00317]|uniref:putative holin n=1 Tax=Mycobacterium sp. ITM-2016-00317 TaxID=2099694 RepID=UPI000D443E9B|nr:putative holin [Mycobacterium sp. ITM-2016-00317]WNG88313.1 putative holin [Mycobacterium sp. ITM-2016-00317]
MIPLPRASVLAGVMIVGVALGMMAALVAAVEITATIRPDLAIGLVVGVPGVVGMAMILLSSKRWATALGAMILAIGPGWLGAMTAIQVASGV